MPLLEILSLIIGIIYGYIKPGKEDRVRLLKNGIVIGLVLGIIFIMIGTFINVKLLMMSSLIGSLAFIEIIIITVAFIIGTYIGDWLEDNYKWT